jgi:hypothetical protein
MACPNGHVSRDVWVSKLGETRDCPACFSQMARTWAYVKAPGITPQGTRPEINFGPAPQAPRIDTKAIAANTAQEIEQKWLRYGDEKIAEQHVSREINEAAGIADAVGNLLPAPTPPPITFAKPPEAHGVHQ